VADAFVRIVPDLQQFLFEQLASIPVGACQPNSRRSQKRASSKAVTKSS
jgi:hypothetical protein